MAPLKPGIIKINIKTTSMNFFTKTSAERFAGKTRQIRKHILQYAGNYKLVIFMRYFFALLLCLLLVIFTNAGPMVVAPAVPGPISGPVNVCGWVGTTETVTYSIQPVPGATLYLWSGPATINIVSGQGTNTIQVTFAPGFTVNANKQLRVRAINDGGNSADRPLNLLSQLPNTPNVIGGPTSACLYIGTSSQAIYRINRVAAATGYIWGSQALTTSVTHPNGPGVNDTVIRVTFKHGFTSSAITVQAVNNCGFSGARSLGVAGVAPPTPGTITGPTNVCPYMLPDGNIATYSIGPVAGATSYTWILPAGSVVDHPNGVGPNDYRVTVQFPESFTSGTVSVIASSGCDDSPPRNLTVTRLVPGTPGVISWAQTIVCPNREYVYSLPSMPTNASSVLWTVPASALGFTGQGGSSITVFYPETPIAGKVTAQGINNCASSSVRQSIVAIGRCMLERPGSTSATTSLRPGVAAALPKQAYTGEMEIKVFPNPTAGDFRVQVNTAGKESLSIRLLDVQGRELKRMTLKPFVLTKIEAKLKPGSYMIEATQGKQVKTARVTKL